MARNKPVSRKVRRDLNALSIRDDFNRGNQLRRDKDDQKNISVSIMDMDSAIMYYFNEVIKPTVVENKDTVSVPILYASPERWLSIQRQGYLRDKKQQLIVPVIVFKRTSIEKNENIPIDKLDANNPANFVTFQQKYSQTNRYDQFSRITGTTPNKEYYNVVVPDYVILNYEFTIWTSYIDQMNKLVEKINYTDGAYWGEPGKMRFKTKIESFTDASEMDSQERLIKTTFGVQMMGYIIPEEFNSMITTQKQLTPKRITIGTETDVNLLSLVTPSDKSETVRIISSKSDTSSNKSILKNPLYFTGGTGITLSGVSRFDGANPSTLTLNIGQDVSTTSNVVFQNVTASNALHVGTNSFAISQRSDGNAQVDKDWYVLGDIVAENYIVSSSVTYMTQSFASGSNIFGDSVDDAHYFTGSVDVNGSISLGGVNLTTTATISDADAYLRKLYVHKQSGISNSTTASFSAITASAPTGTTMTSENDFIFFINGQYMEHDALSIYQNNSTLELHVDTGSIGYSLESDDEIIAQGKFNS